MEVNLWPKGPSGADWKMFSSVEGRESAKDRKEVHALKLEGWRMELAGIKSEHPNRSRLL